MWRQNIRADGSYIYRCCIPLSSKKGWRFITSVSESRGLFYVTPRWLISNYIISALTYTSVTPSLSTQLHIYSPPSNPGCSQHCFCSGGLYLYISILRFRHQYARPLSPRCEPRQAPRSGLWNCVAVTSCGTMKSVCTIRVPSWWSGCVCCVCVIVLWSDLCTESSILGLAIYNCGKTVFIGVIFRTDLCETVSKKIYSVLNMFHMKYVPI